MADIDSIFPNNLDPREFSGKEEGACIIEVSGRMIPHYVCADRLASFDNPIGYGWVTPPCDFKIMAYYIIVDHDIHDDYLKEDATIGQEFKRLHGRHHMFIDFYEVLSDYDKTRVKFVCMPTLSSIN